MIHDLKPEKRENSRNGGGGLATASVGSVSDRARSMPMIDKYIKCATRRRGSKLTADALSDLDSGDSAS